MIGVHEAYLPQHIWIDLVKTPFAEYITYENIFIHEKRSFTQAVAHAIDFTEDNFTGVELDPDCIENSLSSAITPCGISTLQARQYVSLCAAGSKQFAYIFAKALRSGVRAKKTRQPERFSVTSFLIL